MISTYQSINQSINQFIYLANCASINGIYVYLLQTLIGALFLKVLI